MGEEEEDEDMVKETLSRHCAAGGVRAFACDIDGAPIVPPSTSHWAMHTTCKAALLDCNVIF